MMLRTLSAATLSRPVLGSSSPAITARLASGRKIPARPGFLELPRFPGQPDHQDLSYRDCQLEQRFNGFCVHRFDSITCPRRSGTGAFSRSIRSPSLRGRCQITGSPGFPVAALRTVVFNLSPLALLVSNLYPPGMSVAAQAELITDDPRCDGSFADDLREWKRFLQLSKEHGGLLTSSQAGKILGVSNGQMGSWRARGRISSFVILGVPMVPAPEVLALLKERQDGIRQAGGRGLKAPSLAELARAAYEDTKE